MTTLPTLYFSIRTGAGVAALCAQGPIGIMTVVPMGLLYGYVYSRTRQLWPLMVAHVLLDVIGLIQA